MMRSTYFGVRLSAGHHASNQKKKKSATASLNINYSTEDASERAFVFREASVLDIAVSGSAAVVSCNADWLLHGAVAGCMPGAWKN
jgi:hypothetical protein